MLRYAHPLLLFGFYFYSMIPRAALFDIHTTFFFPLILLTSNDTQRREIKTKRSIRAYLLTVSVEKNCSCQSSIHECAYIDALIYIYVYERISFGDSIHEFVYKISVAKSKCYLFRKSSGGTFHANRSIKSELAHTTPIIHFQTKK